MWIQHTALKLCIRSTVLNCSNYDKKRQETQPSKMFSENCKGAYGCLCAPACASSSVIPFPNEDFQVRQCKSAP